MDPKQVSEILNACREREVVVTGIYENDGRVVKVIGECTGDVSRSAYDAFIAGRAALQAQVPVA